MWEAQLEVSTNNHGFSVPS